MSSKLFLTNGNGTIFQNPTSVTFKTLEHFENYFHLSKGYFLCIFHLFFESKMWNIGHSKGKLTLTVSTQIETHLHSTQDNHWSTLYHHRFDFFSLLECYLNEMMKCTICLTSLAWHNGFEIHPCCRM